MRTLTFNAAAAVGLAASMLAGATAAPAADWPMLGRDNTRNAVSPEKGAPARWQVEERKDGLHTRPAWNVPWKAQLGSVNFASPVVAGGLVWVGTNNARPRDPKVKGDASVLMCFRERDGRFLWQYVSPRLPSDHEDASYAGLGCSPLA